jgi:quinoprotein glucose dehydrogenase
MKGRLTGYSGASLACSSHGGDEAVGTLESPDFKLTQNFLSFLVAGGKHPGKTAVQLLIDGKVLHEASGENSLNCKPVTWDLSAVIGKTARIRILDASQGYWGIIAADHFIAGNSANPVFPTTTQAEATPADLISSDSIPGLSIPARTKAKVIADFKSQGLTSPTALTFGEQGELYVTETLRFRHGVPDNRDHLYWYLDDISSRSTVDRRKLHEKWQNQEANTSLKFLTEKEDRVRILSEPDATTGAFQKSAIFAGKFNELLDGPAAGVLAYEGSVFLACIPKIYALQDTDNNGEADVTKVIQDEFGIRISFSGHDLNGFTLGPDGRIYGTLGDRGMNSITREGKHYELPDEGCVFRFDPDGSNFEVIHTGLRNPKEIAFDAHGNAFSVDNNCDQGDKARIVYIVEGADSGWHMGHQGLLVHHRQMGMQERPIASWISERLWELPNAEQPAFFLPPIAHLTSGPSGLTHHPGTGFLESEAGRFLICDYRGSAANSAIWSFKMEESGAGMKLADSRKLNSGTAATDVEYSWDGKLTVTDFIGGWVSHDAGRVYSVEADAPWRATEAAQVAQWIKEGFSKRPTEELSKMLGHPDMRVRLRAQIALTRKLDGRNHLELAARQTTAPLARLHGIWGLGIIARHGAASLGGSNPSIAIPPATRNLAHENLISLLADPSTEVRAQAIKALGDSGLPTRGIPFRSLLADPSPRVQLFAAIAAGKLKSTESIPDLITLLSGTSDLHLRHAGSYALSLLETPSSLAALKSHSDPKIRLAAVIALRRLKAPELAIFLADADAAVSAEAIRAINDLQIISVRPQVAALLDQSADAKRSPMLWRRLLHSAFRTGDAANAHRVLKVALNPQTPDLARAEAFRLLGEWNQPHPVDQSIGRMAPLPARDPKLIQAVLARSVDALMQTDGKFLEAALALILKSQLDLREVPDATLRALVLNEKVSGAARAEALELYAARKPKDFDALLAQLASSKSDDIAIAALRSLVKTKPEAALQGLIQATTHGGIHRQQEAWKLAAAIPGPAATSLFNTQLAALQQKNGVSPAAIELLESAEKRTEPEVKSALASYKAAQAASTDPLAAWLPSLEGGDPVKGGRIFESHPAGQCMRCHAGGHGGGDAGPNLADIGLRRDARYFLESMVIPGAQVAMGYGISSVTLKGGKSVSGIVITDNSRHVDLDSSGKVLRILRSDIDTMTAPVSSMPPMGFMLSAPELRDTVAWLGTQKGKVKAGKPRPAPERVHP